MWATRRTRPPRVGSRPTSATENRPKTVLTHATGEVEVETEIPRDRDGSFDPVIVKRRQRRLSEIDEIVLSLYARGVTTGEIAAHLAQIYGASVILALHFAS